MQQHCLVGATILQDSEIPALRMAETIALAHHERWDGTGYPDGLAGEEIPLAARITAVADVFDALTHFRPYKDAWPVGRAVAEIKAGSGTRFDPDVVGAFLTLEAEELLAPVEPDPLLAGSR
jgi:putative two-component system response regulator